MDVVMDETYSFPRWSEDRLAFNKKKGMMQLNDSLKPVQNAVLQLKLFFLCIKIQSVSPNQKKRFPFKLKWKKLNI